MKHASILFLKLAIIVFGLFILWLCIFLVPGIANYVQELLKGMSYVKYIIVIDLYVVAMMVYFGLYEGFKLLSYIQKDKAFSKVSLKALKNIKNCGIAISVLYAVGLPLNYLIGDADDAPGIILIGLVMIFASMVIAVFAGVIERLFQDAIDIKSENDLTI